MCQPIFANAFFVAAIACVWVIPRAVDSATAAEDLVVVYEEDFDNLDPWRVTDDACWKLAENGKKPVLSLYKKKGNYQPPHRSPFTIAWLSNAVVSDFQLDVEVLSTHKDYGHRDACLFFGGQDPGKFYYVHLGKNTDNHANQIFIVNDSARTKISTKTTPGTPWDDNWHHVRVTRCTESGNISVYFDDMETPAMTATDKTFTWGSIGVGSFDDTADFRSIILRGTQVEGKEAKMLP